MAGETFQFLLASIAFGVVCGLASRNPSDRLQAAVFGAVFPLLAVLALAALCTILNAIDDDDYDGTLWSLFFWTLALGVWIV